MCVPSPWLALAQNPGSPLPAGLPAQVRVQTGEVLFPQRKCSVRWLFLCPSQKPPMTKAGAVQGGVPVGRGRRRDCCLKATLWGEAPGRRGRQEGAVRQGQPPGCGVCSEHCGPLRAWAARELTFGPRCGLQGAGREGWPPGGLCSDRGNCRAACLRNVSLEALQGAAV